MHLDSFEINTFLCSLNNIISSLETSRFLTNSNKPGTELVKVEDMWVDLISQEAERRPTFVVMQVLCWSMDSCRYGESGTLDELGGLTKKKRHSRLTICIRLLYWLGEGKYYTL